MSDRLEHQAKEMRSKVFLHMLETRGRKYRAFLRYLRFFKYAAFAPLRGKFLESYYTMMRFLDDVVDGDIPLPKGYRTESEYMTKKIIFSKSLSNPEDEIDYLMLYCFELANRLGLDFHLETQDILTSLLFDANRKGKDIIYSNEELMHHFHLLDIRGTIKATLKIFKEDPDKYKILEPLGMACRYQYDLEDFRADVAVGYINISKEECDRFDLNLEDIHNSSSTKIKNWFRYRASEGLALLDEHHRRLPEGSFSFLSRATFLHVYETPARKAFQKILVET